MTSQSSSGPTDPPCTFCGKAWATTQETDEKGQVFYVCGWCWAHVIHAIQPKDAYKLAKSTRRWLSSVTPHPTSR